MKRKRSGTKAVDGKRKRTKTTSKHVPEVDRLLCNTKVEFCNAVTETKLPSATIPAYENPLYVGKIDLIGATTSYPISPHCMGSNGQRYKRSHELKLKKTTFPESQTSAISIQKQSLLLKCPWCLIKFIERKIHDQHCYCSTSKKKIGSGSCLYFGEFIYNDTKLYQKHILESHIIPQNKDAFRKFDEMEGGDGKKRKKKNVTILNSKMDVVVWVSCPFDDCGLKLKTPRDLVDHLLRRHSPAISVKVQKQPNPNDVVMYPLGFNVVCLASRAQCLVNKNQSTGTYLQFVYNGLSDTEFIQGINYSLITHKKTSTQQSVGLELSLELENHQTVQKEPDCENQRGENNEQAI